MLLVGLKPNLLFLLQESTEPKCKSLLQQTLLQIRQRRLKSPAWDFPSSKKHETVTMANRTKSGACRTIPKSLPFTGLGIPSTQPGGNSPRTCETSGFRGTTRDSFSRWNRSEMALLKRRLSYFAATACVPGRLRSRRRLGLSDRWPEGRGRTPRVVRQRPKMRMRRKYA